MPLCSFSSKLALDGYTVVENSFFNEFLPQATGDDVKVYLFGLSLCNSPNVEENSLDTIAKVLSLTEEQVKNAFSYWQEMGLVQVVSENPYEVRFLPAQKHSGSGKIRNAEKYSDFNDSVQGILTGRMITPTEFNEYYTLIEVYHFEPEALLHIISYCARIKSNAIGYPYILAVARSFANEGVKTYEAVEQKILEQETASADVKQVLKALGLKRDADIDERNLYTKWTSIFGFTHGVIVQIAKNMGRGGFSKLDELLTKYYEQKLFSAEEVENFSKKQAELYETAKKICKTIGLSYQNYDNVVDTYVADWDAKGYEEDALMFIAQFCFNQSIRTLDGVNVVIQKFYKLGLITFAAIEQHIESTIQNDEKIKEILDAFGLLRSVSSYDRSLYKTWTENWGFDHSQIMTVVSGVREKTNSLSYMGRILSSLHNENIKDNEKIEEYLKRTVKNDGKQTNQNGFMTRNLSKEQLSAVFDSIDDIEI